MSSLNPQPLVAVDSLLGVTFKGYWSGSLTSLPVSSDQVLGWVREVVRKLKGQGETDYGKISGPFYGLTIEIWDTNRTDVPALGLDFSPSRIRLAANQPNLAVTLVRLLGRLYVLQQPYLIDFMPFWDTLRPSLDFVERMVLDFQYYFGPDALNQYTDPGDAITPDPAVRFFLKAMHPVGQYLDVLRNTFDPIFVDAAWSSLDYGNDGDGYRFRWQLKQQLQYYREDGRFELVPPGPAQPFQIYEFGNQPFRESRIDQDLVEQPGANRLIGRSVFDVLSQPLQNVSGYRFSDGQGWLLRGRTKAGEPKELPLAELTDWQTNNAAQPNRAGRRGLPARAVLVGGFFDAVDNSAANRYGGLSYLSAAPMLEIPFAYQLDPAWGVGGSAVSNGRHVYVAGNKLTPEVIGDSTIRTITRIGHVEIDPPAVLGSQLNASVWGQAAVALSDELFAFVGGSGETGSYLYIDLLRRHHLISGVEGAAWQGLASPLLFAAGTRTQDKPVLTGVTNSGGTASDQLFFLEEGIGLQPAFSSLSSARTAVSAVYNYRNVFFLGGRSSSSVPVMVVDWFDAAGAARNVLGLSLTEALADTCGVAIGEAVFAVGGTPAAGSAGVSTVQQLEPSSGSFVTVLAGLTPDNRGLTEIAGAALAPASAAW